jgi:hypothetical protein
VSKEERKAPQLINWANAHSKKQQRRSVAGVYHREEFAEMAMALN